MQPITRRLLLLISFLTVGTLIALGRMDSQLPCKNLGLPKSQRSATANSGLLPGSDVQDIIHAGDQIGSLWAARPVGEELALPLAETTSSNKRKYRLAIVDPRHRKVQAVIMGGQEVIWSPNGGSFAYTKTTERLLWNNVTAMMIGVHSWPNGSADTLPTTFVDRDLDWHLDGEHLAFARLDYGRQMKSHNDLQGRVMVTQWHGKTLSKPRAVGAEHFGVSVPRWRPAGHDIAYVATDFSGEDNSIRKTDIFLVNTRTGREDRITLGGDAARNALAWSPSGKHIVFVRGFPQLRTLVSIDARSREERVIFRASDLGEKKPDSIASIQWSPNGKQIVFSASYRRNNTVLHDIGEVELMSGQFSWLTNDGQSRSPRWPRDGRKILFVRHNNEIWEMNREDSLTRMVFRLASLEESTKAK